MRKPVTLLAALVAVSLVSPPAVMAGTGEYTVRSGDSIWAIAHRESVTISALLAANDLTLTSTIMPGQTLAIPGREPRSGGTSTRETVRSGDSLWAIAQRTRTTLEALLAANDMTTTSMIHPGQTVVVPIGSTSVPAWAATAPAPSSASTYVVRPGDGLTTIARRVGVRTSSLLAANALEDHQHDPPGTAPEDPSRSRPR